MPQKKYKKGSCENCGATTHKSVDCVERPRARGAKWTNSEIAPDEYIPTEDLSQFEAKRDRWGGYDPDAFGLVVEEYVAAEEEATKRRVDQELAAAAQTEGGSGGVDDTDSSSESEDGGGAKIKDFDVSNAPVGTKDDRTRTTTRNLRIREDTAKYLINLDLDSAFYDPKTRSMRGDPTLGLDPSIQEKIPYRGDNAVRLTGEADIVNQYEAFAWEARKHGQVIHKQANPTQIELAYQEHEKRKKVTKIIRTTNDFSSDSGDSAPKRAPPTLWWGSVSGTSTRIIVHISCPVSLDLIAATPWRIFRIENGTFDKESGMRSTLYLCPAT